MWIKLKVRVTYVCFRGIAPLLQIYLSISKTRPQRIIGSQIKIAVESNNRSIGNSTLTLRASTFLDDFHHSFRLAPRCDLRKIDFKCPNWIIRNKNLPSILSFQIFLQTEQQILKYNRCFTRYLCCFLRSRSWEFHVEYSVVAFNFAYIKKIP